MILALQFVFWYVVVLLGIGGPAVLLAYALWGRS